MAKKKPTHRPGNIVVNKKARHEYFIEEKFEAGLALQGWEVKSLREGKVNLTEGFVFTKNGEAFMSGCHILPLPTASTHISPDPTRIRKLLLHKKEIAKIFGEVAKKNYTCVPLQLYWKNGHVKLEIGLAKGKQDHDKRATTKERDWNREKQRILKNQ